MKYKCVDCGEIFDEWQAVKWISEIKEEGKEEKPCCPNCGSENTDKY